MVRLPQPVCQPACWSTCPSSAPSKRFSNVNAAACCADRPKTLPHSKSANRRTGTSARASHTTLPSSTLSRGTQDSPSVRRLRAKSHRRRSHRCERLVAVAPRPPAVYSRISATAYNSGLTTWLSLVGFSPEPVARPGRSSATARWTHTSLKTLMAPSHGTNMACLRPSQSQRPTWIPRWERQRRRTGPGRRRRRMTLHRRHPSQTRYGPAQLQPTPLPVKPSQLTSPAQTAHVIL